MKGVKSYQYSYDGNIIDDRFHYFSLWNVNISYDDLFEISNQIQSGVLDKSFDHLSVSEYLNSMYVPYSKSSVDKFLFISHADEQNYWKGWKESRDKVYAFFNSLKQPKILFKNREYIDKGHRTSFLSALYDGMKEYTKYLDSLPKQKHVISITVNVPNKTDEVYITGNQKELGNWEEGKIKMDSISPFKRKISLTLVNKTQIRFTNGNSKSNKVAEIENYDLPWLFYIPITPEF